MRKWSLRIVSICMVAATALLCSANDGYASLTTSVEEKPLAGISVSLDEFCNVLIANEEEEEREVTQLSQIEAGVTDSSQNGNVLSPEQKKEENEKKSQIRLNFNLSKLGVSNVDKYLNVRKTPSENAKIVGKLSKNAGCDILSSKSGWCKIESGKIRGYVKSKYLLKGEKAQKKAYEVATLKAIVKTSTLNVRYLPSTESKIYDQISEDDDYTVEKKDLSKDYMKKYIAKHISKKDLSEIDVADMYENLGNWVMISIDNERAFVSKDFISLRYRLGHAVKFSENSDGSSSATSSGTKGIVSYAMQFLGNPYVWGGTSLTNGTDCSGFTQGIYRHFGKYLPRTSSAQAAYTKTVDPKNVQVGDLFFYGSGHVSHVALYIGNGQIIHASNRREGIKISNAYYRKPLKIGRVG